MTDSSSSFFNLPIEEQTKVLYLTGTFILSIRYYSYKVNLYLLEDTYVEVFYNHKLDIIERVQPLDYGHTRMKFYEDQISLGSIPC